jgi:hypothetical protein
MYRRLNGNSKIGQIAERYKVLGRDVWKVEEARGEN